MHSPTFIFSRGIRYCDWVAVLIFLLFVFAGPINLNRTLLSMNVGLQWFNVIVLGICAVATLIICRLPLGTTCRGYCYDYIRSSFIECHQT